MGRSSDSTHFLTLVLITLMAWPWNVMLSLVESSRIAATDQVGIVLVPETSGAQRVVRVWPLDRLDRGLTVYEFDSDDGEEEDEERSQDKGPSSLTWEVSLIWLLIEHAPQSPSYRCLVSPPKAFPPEQLCRFRC